MILIACFFLGTMPVQALSEIIQEELEWQEILNASDEAEQEDISDIEALDNVEIVEPEEGEEAPYHPDSAVNEYKTDRFIVKYKEDSHSWNVLKTEDVDGKAGTLGRNTQGEGKTSAFPVKRIEVDSDTAGFGRSIQSAELVVEENLLLLTTAEVLTTKELLESAEVQSLEKEIEYIQPDYEMEPASVTSYLKELLGQQQLDDLSLESHSFSIKEALTDSSYKTDTGLAAAWEISKGENVIVALLDTGVETTHEGLKRNLLPGWDFVNDRNGVNDTEYHFDQGHGTMMAGIIAGKGNESGEGFGVAPGAKLLPLKVFQEGKAYTSDIIRAIQYAEAKGAKVANLSFGSRFDNPALREAIAESNMLFVCAVGNNGYNLDKYPVYPASFGLDNIIAVSSLDESGKLSIFSNYGEKTVDVAAPGEEILSTWLDHTYQKGSGTSVATAYVSGEAALIFALDKYGSAKEVKERIIQSSDHISGLRDKVREGRKISCAYAVSNRTGENTNELSVEDSPREDMILGEMPDREDFELYADGYVSMRTSMSTARHGLAVVAANNKIYAIGGQTTANGGYSNIVEEYDPARDEWTKKADMPVAKSYFGYFVYNNKVYVLGGFNGSYLSSVEVYDPIANTWASKGNIMPIARKALTVTLDPTIGKAYAIGGYNGGYLNTVHEFNPDTFAFTEKPNITTRRSDHVAFYYDGKIYVESGLGAGEDRVYSEEQYNVSTGVTVNGGAPRTFMANAAGVAVEDRFIGIGGKSDGDFQEFTTEMTHSSLKQLNTPGVAYSITKSQMNIARAGLGAAVLNGKVYMAGGINSNSVFAYLEELDLGWQVKAPLPIPLSSFKSIEADGKIYIFGGTTQISGVAQRSKAVYAYDPIKNIWVQQSDMPYYGSDFSIASAYGKVYLIGGSSSSSINGSFFSTDKVYEYDCKTNLWSEKASIGRVRNGAAAIFYQHKIYVLGGGTGNGLYVDEYDPLNNTWTSKRNLPAARTSPYAHVLNNQLFVSDGYQDSLLVYEANKDTWQTKIPAARRSGSLHFALSDIIFCFQRGDNYITPNIYEYYPNENTWAYYKTFNFIGRLNQVATLNNKAYIFIGSDSYSTGLVEYSVSKTPWVERANLDYFAAGVGAAAVGETIYAVGGEAYRYGYFNHLRAYNTATGGWENKAAMPTNRGYFGMASVGRKIYAIGGENDSAIALNRVEEYNPETNSWTARSNLPNALSHISAVEAGGKLYVIGGRNSYYGAVNTVYEYNPATNIWTAKASMPTARYGASIGVIGDKIYVAGGFRSTYMQAIPPMENDPTNVLEVYDIATNTWATKAALPYSFGYAGSAARDTFYVIGGYDNYNEFSLVYEYSPVLDRWLTWPGPKGKCYSFGTVLTSDGIYAIAGQNNSGYTSGVEFAPISMLTSDFIHLGEEQINPSGNFARTYTDLEYSVPGFNMMFTRTYNSSDKRASSISTGWTFGFESKLTEEGNNAVVRLPNGSGLTFGVNAANGTYTAKDSRSTLVKQADGTKIMTTADQYSYAFDAKGYMIWMKDRNGNKIDIAVNADGKVTAVQDPAGRKNTITYENNRISQITDPAGRIVKYAYDGSGKLVTVTNPSGSTNSYEYDSNGYLVKVQDATGHPTETITYYPMNADETIPRVKTVTDIYGNVQNHVYDKVEGKVAITDSNHRESITWFDKMLYPIRTRDAENKETRTTYLEEGGINKYGEMTSFTDEAGNSTYYDRDDRGNIIRQLNPDETIKEFVYDSKNNLLSEKDEEGKMTFHVYDANGIDVLKTVQPLNGTDTYTAAAPQHQFAITEKTYYTEAEAQGMCGKPIAGLLKSVRDPEGNLTSYTYDANGYLATEKDGLNQITYFQYNPIGWLKQETGVAGYTIKYYYDKLGHVVKKINHGGETERHVYDNRENVVQKISPNQYSAANDPTLYDANNVVVNANAYNAADHGDRYTYLSNNLLQKEINPLHFETKYTYDQYGNMLTKILPNGLETTHTYDVINRLKTTTIKEEPSSIAQVTDEYDYVLKNGGQMETVHIKHLNGTDVAVTKETLDYAGRIVRIDNPDGGFTTNEYLGNGKLLKETDPRGNSTYYSYDGLNRLSGVWSPADSGLYMYKGTEYDKSGNVAKIVQSRDKVSALQVPATNLIWNASVYDAQGRRIEDTDSMGGKTTYTYSDQEDMMTQRKYRDGANYDQTLKKYNHLGEVRENTTYVNPTDFSSGASELKDVYTFDKEGNVLTYKKADGVVITYTYDLLGNQLTVTQPAFDENNVEKTITDTYTYNFRGSVLTEKNALGRVTSYEYDKRGNQVKIVDAKSGVTYCTYDLANRKIVEVTPRNYTSGSTENMNRREYTYDACDRVITEKDFYRDIGSNLKYLVRSFTYDLNGNKLTAKDGIGNVTTYTYDGGNREISVCDPENAARGLYFTTKFIYDGMGRKIEERNANDVATVFRYNDHGDLVASLIGGELIKSSTYDFAGNRLTESDGNGNAITYLYNHIGEVKEAVYPGDESIASYRITYQYTDLGQVVRSETSFGRVNAFTYDHQGNTLVELAMKNDGTEKLTKSSRYDLLGNLRFAINERGDTVEYVYDELNRKIATKVPVTINGQVVMQTTTTEYDADGNIISLIDWKGNKYTNIYDSLGRIIEKRDPYNNIIESLIYDENHQQTHSTDALSNTNMFEYDKAGRLIFSVDAEEKTKWQGYDAAGNKISETDGRGNVTNYFYDAQKRLIQVTNALGEDTIYTYDQAGNLLTQKDGNGREISYAYNVRNLPTMKIDAGESENRIEYYAYHADDLLSKKTDRNGVLHRYAYDIHGRKIEDDAGGSLVSYTYNELGSMSTMSDSTGVTNRTYDELGRVTSKTVQGIGTTIYAYDQTAGLPAGFSAEITTDPKGNVTAKVLDKAGRLHQVKDGSAVVATYSYYNNGNRKSVNYQGSGSEEYTYYANNLLKTLVNKSGSATIEAYSYNYDPNGNLQTKTDKKGKTTYAYDSLNRLDEVVEPSGKRTEYAFDQGGNRSTEIITEGEEITLNCYTYNEHNQLVAVERKVNDSLTGGVDYSYDPNGNMISSVPYSIQGASAEMKMQNNLLPSVLKNDDVQKLWDTEEKQKYLETDRNEEHRGKEATFETETNANQLQNQTTIDGNGSDLTDFLTLQQEPVKVETIQIPTDLYDVNAKKSLNGYEKETNVEEIDKAELEIDKEELEGSINIDGGREDVTDEAQTLPQEERPQEVDESLFEGDDHFKQEKVTIEEFSLADNMKAKEEGVSLYLLGEEDIPQSPTLYTYDNRNNLTKTTQGANITLSKYNGDGLRVEKKVNGKSYQYLYEYDKIVLEVGEDGQETARNIYGMNLLKRNAEGGSLTYMYNGHGDVTALLNQNGQVAAEYYYDAFGVILEETATVNNPFRYAGYEYDKESGLYYLKSRHYDPTNARFLQEDTYRGEINDPLSLNLYTYCQNKPIRYTDPDGHREAGDDKLSLADQKRIDQLTNDYNAAKAKGDKAGMDKAHKAAAAIRETSGVKEYANYTKNDPYKYSTKAMIAASGELKKGSVGSTVSALQHSLQTQGYSIGRSGVDGSFGKSTQAAVIRFQIDKGLEYNGIVGNKTASALVTSLKKDTNQVSGSAIQVEWENLNELGTLVGFAGNGLDALGELGKIYFPKSLANMPRPNNIGPGTWMKEVARESTESVVMMEGVSKFGKKVGAVGIVIDVVQGGYNDYSAGKPLGKVGYNIVVNAAVDVGGLGAGKLGSMVGGAIFGPTGKALGGPAAGITYMIVVDSVKFKGLENQTPRDWVKGLYDPKR